MMMKHEKNDDSSYESSYVNLLWSHYRLITIISSFILADLSILRQNICQKIKIHENMLFWLGDCPRRQSNCTRGQSLGYVDRNFY